MECRHFFLDKVGYQPLSEYDAKLLGRKDFLLGQCIVCLSSVCADKYLFSGESFEGKELLFSPNLDDIIGESYV